MKKIPTLFVRDPDDRKHVLPTVTPGCEWVMNGEGTATRKYDGTCVLVRGGKMFARREVKPGKAAPAEFEPVEHNEITGKTVGWVPVTDDHEYARHWEAWVTLNHQEDGTYELIGPKVNGNPEGARQHLLIRHGREDFGDVPLAFDGLRDWLLAHPFEGIVWHHPDGRMAKLKRRDFA